MAEEPETSPQTENPQSRRCPACGSRVAEMATTCLMCGAPLIEEEVELEEEEEEEEEEKKLGVDYPAGSVL